MLRLYQVAALLLLWLDDNTLFSSSIGGWLIKQGWQSRLLPLI